MATIKVYEDEGMIENARKMGQVMTGLHQELAAKHFYRPSLNEHAEPEDLQRFKEIELFSVDDVFGGWPEAQAKHFNDGGLFDVIQEEIASSK